jgi:DNA primase
MTSSDNFKESLKQQADIVRIVGDYVRLKKAGAQNFSGLCPFHSEKTPSFSVHATRQFYHCFGCGASGDVFSFVQKMENISFPEAVRLIAQKLGVPMPKVSFSSPQEARDAKLRMALLDVHERAVEFFQQCLRRPEGARAREYLKGRGLDDETIARFRIGYAPDSGFQLRDALRRDFDEETLRESGLFSWKEAASSEPRATSGQVPDAQPSAVGRQEEKSQVSGLRSQENGAPPDSGDREQEVPGTTLECNDSGATENRELRTENSKPETRGSQLAAIYSKFRNRVMFPIANDQGKVIAFTGRTLATDEKAGPKYLNSPETKIYSKSRVLFNLDHAKEAIRKLEYSILVEGQMDCISVYAAGFHNVMASSGTAFTELQARLLGRFSKNIIVNFDPDTAGARATERTLGLLVEEEFNIRVLTLETGFDPDLFIRRKGKDAYGEALKHSQKYFDYLIDRARTQFGVRSPETKVKAVNYLLPHIQRVPNRISRDELAMEISQKLGIDSSVLRQELKHAATSRAATAVKAPAEAQVTSAERVLIRALATAREMHAGEGRFSARDGAEEEFDPARQAHFALAAERLHIGLSSESLMTALMEGGAEVSDPLDLARSDEDRRLLASILMHDEEELTPDNVEGAVRALRRIALRRQLEEVQRRVLAPGLSQEEKQTLLQEKVRLKRALMDPGLDEAARAS